MQNTKEQSTITKEEAEIFYKYYDEAYRMLFGHSEQCEFVPGIVVARRMKIIDTSHGMENEVPIFVTGAEMLMLRKILESKNVEEALEVYLFFRRDAPASSPNFGMLNLFLLYHKEQIHKYRRIFQMVEIEPPPLPSEIVKYFRCDESV